MLNQVYGKLSSYQRQVLLDQSQQALNSWEEVGNPELEYDGHVTYSNLNNDEGSVLVLYRCECGKLLAELEEVGEYGECVCGRNYLGLDEE